MPFPLSLRRVVTDQPRLRQLFARGSMASVAERLVLAACSEAQQRKIAYAVLALEPVELTFERAGTHWTVDAGDAVGRSLFVEGTYEAWAIAPLVEWLTAQGRTGTILDVGANVGSTTIPFAQAGHRVIAVEPVPTTFQMLRRNVIANGLDATVSCVNCAISDRDGHVVMWTTPHGSGLSEVAVDDRPPAFTADGFETSGSVEVESARLDPLLERLSVEPSEVALVWSDAQGSETAVIETGEQLWSAGVPLFLEVDPRNLELHGGLDRFLRAVTSRFIAFHGSLDFAAAPIPIHAFESFVRGLPVDVPPSSVLLLAKPDAP